VNEPERLLEITRRHFFKQTGFGIGSLALASLLKDQVPGADQGQRQPPIPSNQAKKDSSQRQHQPHIQPAESDRIGEVFGDMRNGRVRVMRVNIFHQTR